jgi:hypothetical protein
MSLDELSYFLGLDSVKQDSTQQKLLLTFDATKKDAMWTALRDSARSVSLACVDWALEDLKELHHRNGALPTEMRPLGSALQCVNKGAARQKFLQACNSCAGNFSHLSHCPLPRLFQGFSSILTPEQIVVCDQLYLSAWGSSEGAVDEQKLHSEESIGLMYLEKLEMSALVQGIMNAERLSTKALKDVDLLVTASLLIFEAPEKDLEIALSQWPFNSAIRPDSMDRQIRFTDKWRRLIRRLERTGWELPNRNPPMIVPYRS